MMSLLVGERIKFMSLKEDIQLKIVELSALVDQIPSSQDEQIALLQAQVVLLQGKIAQAVPGAQAALADAQAVLAALQA